MSDNAARVAEQIIDWIRERVSEAGASGTVVALSGGIDAAVTVALCKRAFPDDTLGVILPCHSHPADEADARLHAQQADIPVVTIDLTQVYDVLLDAIGQARLPSSSEPVGRQSAGSDGEVFSVAGLRGEVLLDRDSELNPGANPDDSGDDSRRRLALANIKPRLRMTALYYVANRHNYLVVGTENLSELTVGYFTKHGDGGVDILPIANLVKSQVYQLARYLGVPDKIIRRVPGAGLWAGQTDENEMGLTYEELDKYILTGTAPPDVKAKIDRLHRTSEHKRQRPPIAPVEW